MTTVPTFPFTRIMEAMYLPGKPSLPYDRLRQDPTRRLSFSHDKL